MSKKKMLFSVTAGAAIASTLIGVDDAEAASHKVKSGDSLWKIANSYDTTVDQLKKINNLNGSIIFPNQVIETSSSKEEKPAKSSSSSNSSSKAETYTVKSGDSLSKIASKYGVSFKDIMKWNDLSTTLIFPGNVLTVSEGNSSGSSKPNPPKKESSPSKSSTTYVVKSGDTLSHIAKDHGVSVSNLKKWNNISSHIIHIGQKLTVKDGGNKGSGPVKDKPAASKPPEVHDGFDVDKLLKAANDVMGTPYVWAGQSPGGFDCSGFIHFAYDQAGMSTSRTSTDGYFNRSHYIDKPQVGDLVFFKGTYRAGISHMGIYVGNNEFIHAGSSTGVTKTSLDNPYWKQHFDSFKRFY